jgi:hypothetical protein
MIPQAPHLFGEFGLVGRIRRSGFIGIAREKDGVDIAFYRCIHGKTQAIDKVLQARMQPGRGIQASVVFDPDVNVGKMKYSYWFHSSDGFSQYECHCQEIMRVFQLQSR